MTTLVFIDPAGQEHVVEAEEGQSLMQAASEHLVPGIEASCGGNCICATCHCYLDEAVLGQVPAPDEIEQSMIECLAEPRAGSRLTCQVRVSDALKGARIVVAQSQH